MGILMFESPETAKQGTEKQLAEERRQLVHIFLTALFTLEILFLFLLF